VERRSLAMTGGGWRDGGADGDWEDEVSCR
jgi:hypothetical protein